MKGWQITSKGEFGLIEKEASVLLDGQVKVRIAKAAITSTDGALYLGQGEYPIIPVRAATGVISESISDEFKKGEKVVISPYINNAESPRAHSHADQKKDILFSDIDIMGVTIDGFLRDFVVLPQENVVPIPDGVDDTEAVFVEHIALALKVLDVLGIKNNEYVAILGGNSLCNIFAQLVMYYHGIPIIIDNDKDLLNICRANGIYYTINPTETDCINRVMEITGGKMAEHVVFESRARLPFSSALSLAKKKGCVALMGFNIFADKMDLNITPILRKQLTFTGINNGYNEIASAVNILANKILKLSPLISHKTTFDGAPEIIKDLALNPHSYRSVIIE
ncbi:MAG: zinc-binding dehydrogenase [Clostridiales bacterium]|jgi:threonine dehydrogenase-like Zn-dependent dehydrogenase|nr:zinc-binding dehydrogenase [Clostridiales bacterium]